MDLYAPAGSSDVDTVFRMPEPDSPPASRRENSTRWSAFSNTTRSSRARSSVSGSSLPCSKGRTEFYPPDHRPGPVGRPAHRWRQIAGIFAAVYQRVNVPLTLWTAVLGVAAVMIVRFTASFLVAWFRETLRMSYIRGPPDGGVRKRLRRRHRVPRRNGIRRRTERDYHPDVLRGPSDRAAGPVRRAVLSRHRLRTHRIRRFAGAYDPHGHCTRRRDGAIARRRRTGLRYRQPRRGRERATPESRPGRYAGNVGEPNIRPRRRTIR